MAKASKTGNTAVPGIQGTSTSSATTGNWKGDNRTQKQKYIDAYIDAKQGGSSAQEAASVARSTVGMPANAATTTSLPDGFTQADVVSRNGRIYATDSAQQAYINRAMATMAEREAATKAANNWSEKNAIQKAGEILRDIDRQAYNQFMSNISGLAASALGRDTFGNDIFAAWKAITDKNDGVSAWDAIRGLDRQGGNRILSGLSGAAEKIWDAIGGTINKFGGNVDTENDPVSAWNRRRQAIEDRDTAAFYGKTGEVTNPIAEWNDRMKAAAQNAQQANAEKYAGSAVASNVYKYGTQVWSQAPTIMMTVAQALLSPVSAADDIAGGLAAASTKGLEFLSKLNNSNKFQQLGMMIQNGIGNLAQNPQFWYSYSQEAGGAYNEAVDEGAGEKAASLYSTVYGALSAMVEVGGVDEALGGIENLPKNVREALMGGNKRLATWLYVKSIADEIKEEEVQEVLSKILRMGYDDNVKLFSTEDENAIINPGRMLETAKDTAITTALMGAGERAFMGGVQRAADSRTYTGESEALIQTAKQTENEQDALRAAQIERTAADRRNGRLRVGEARELYGIVERNGGADAYARAIIESERQQKTAAAQQEEVRQLMGRVQTDVDATAKADTGSASIEYDGQNARVDFVRSDGKNAIQLTMEDGTKKVITPAEARDAGLDSNVLNLIYSLSWAGENAPALYSVYDGEQEVGRYAAAMHQAVDLYAANGVDVRKAAQQARENSQSVTMIGELNDAQLEMAQALGNKIYAQKQEKVKEQGAKLRKTRQEAEAAIQNPDIGASETMTAINTSIKEAREYIQSQRTQYNDTVEMLEEMQRLGLEDSPEYRALYEQAQQYRRNIEGTERAIADLEEERKRQQDRQPVKRKKGTVRFDGATDGKKTYEGVDPSRLNGKQKAVVEMAKDLADVLDLDFVFFQGPAGVGGFYRGGSTIYVNINSGMGVGNFNKVIAAGSMSHELTHWLKQYAPEEYEELQRYILNDIAEKQGPDALDKLIRQQQRWERGRQMTREEAIDEVVANACQTMLRDSKAITELAQQNRTLAEKIHDFLQKLVERIKAAFADVDIRDSAPIYDAARAIEASYEEILQLWDKTLQEAAQNNRAARATETAEANENAIQAEEETETQNQKWDELTSEEAAPVKQEISSADTSINANKLPVLYTDKNAIFQEGGTNVDIGGGRFDNVTEYLADKGVTNMLFDPYNRSEETNTATLRYLMDGNRADTATCSNVLNVIAEQAARDNVILEAAKAIKPDGKAYFTVYEGDGEGTGRATKSGWQENRKTATYVPEIQKYFDTVTRKGKLIIAEDPKADLPKAAWEVTPGTAVKFQKWDENPDQISLDEWINGGREELRGLHPELKAKLDEAANLMYRVEKFFENVPEDSENYLNPDEIKDMMEVDLHNDFGVAGEMSGAEEIAQRLSNIAKAQTPQERRKTWQLLEELVEHLSPTQQTPWFEERWSEDEAFTAWHLEHRPSLYYPGYQAGDLMYSKKNRDREIDYLTALALNEAVDRRTRQEAMAMLDAMGTKKTTWYQQWSEEQPDLAYEAQGRDIAYTMLQSENEALQDTVKALNVLTKKQGTTIGKLQQRLKITKTPEVRESDARTLAGRLIREHSSKADREQLTKEIKALGDSLLQAEEVDQEELMRQARMIAAEIAGKAETPNEMDADTETAANIVQDIRGKKLLLPEQFKGELDTVGGYNAFRQKNAFNFTLATQERNEAKEGYTGIDKFYTSLQRSWGTLYFPDVANEGEQIQVIADMFERAKPALINPYEQYMGEAVEAMANDIVQDALSGILRPTEPSTADKWNSRYKLLREQIKDLQQQGEIDEKEAQMLRETVYDLSLALDQADSRYRTLQTSMRERLAQVETEGRTRAAERLARQKERENAKIAGLKQHYQEQAKRAREKREENKGIQKYRRQVIDKAKKLSDWLEKNSDKEHVPEVLKAPLLELLTSIDYTSTRALNGGEETAADRKFGARLQRLQQMLSNQQSYINGDGSIQEDLGGYIDVSPDMLQFLREMAEKVTAAMNAGQEYTINRMNAAELKDLSNLLSSISAGIRNMNKLMANERYASVREAASEDIEYMKSLGRADEKEGNKLSRFLKWKDGVPYYVFKRFGGGGQSIFDGLTRGWEKLAFHAKEIIDFTEKTYTDKEVNAWKKEMHEITLESGEKIRMTTAQIMALRQLLKRDQARQHLEAGGMRIGNIETGKGRITDTAHYHLGLKDIETILGTLTKRQTEVADALQHFMAVRGAELGNEVSLKRFGYRFYTEGENYYPITTDANDRAMQDTDAQQNSMFRLLNLSSSKSLNPRANNALVVNDIFDTFADHMADQAKLNALGLPILDAIKWFNFKEKVDLGDGTFDTRTLQGAMEQAYLDEAQHYFRTFMKDVNGVTESGDRGTDLTSKMMSNYKVAAVAANLRVALLQPTAYIRSLTTISPRNLLRAFAYKNATQEALANSGTALWKSLGYYDTNISRSMRQQIQHNETWKDKVQEASMKGAEIGDSRTWGRLWVASRLQAQDMYKDLSGDALMQKTAEIFRKVVYSSQVMDSTLTRSELMRGRTQATKALTAFMAEPTLSFNVLLDAYSEYQNDVRRHGKQGAWKRNQDKIGRAFTVYASSAAVSAIAESIMDAVRDDDDYENFLDKFLQALFGEGNPLEGNLLQDLLVTGKIPYVKNIVNLLTGYSGSSDMSTEGLSTLLSAVQIWRETIELEAGMLDKPTKVTYYGNMTNWGKIYKTLQALSQLSGLPVSAALRDVFAIWNTTAGSIVPYWKIKTYDAGTKSNVKQALGAGYLTEEEATQILLEEGVYANAEAAGKDVYKWMENAGSAYDPLFKAIRKGDATEAGRLRQSMVDHGYSDSTINGKVKQEVKDWYLDEGMSRDEAEAALINYAGMNARDAGAKLEWWGTLQANPQIDADGNGSVKQDEVGSWLVSQVNAGRISQAQADDLWYGVTAGDASPWKKTFSEWKAKQK